MFFFLVILSFLLMTFNNLVLTFPYDDDDDDYDDDDDDDRHQESSTITPTTSSVTSDCDDSNDNTEQEYFQSILSENPFQARCASQSSFPCPVLLWTPTLNDFWIDLNISNSNIYGGFIVCNNCNYSKCIDLNISFGNNLPQNVTFVADGGTEDTNCHSTTFRFYSTIPLLYNVTVVNISFMSLIGKNVSIQKIDLFDIKGNISRNQPGSDLCRSLWRTSQGVTTLCCGTPSTSTAVKRSAVAPQINSNNNCSQCVVYNTSSFGKISLIRILISQCSNDDETIIQINITGFSDRSIQQLQMSKLNATYVDSSGLFLYLISIAETSMDYLQIVVLGDNLFVVIEDVEFYSIDAMASFPSVTDSSRTRTTDHVTICNNTSPSTTTSSAATTTNPLSSTSSTPTSTAATSTTTTTTTPTTSKTTSMFNPTPSKTPMTSVTTPVISSIVQINLTFSLLKFTFIPTYSDQGSDDYKDLWGILLKPLTEFCEEMLYNSFRNVSQMFFRSGSVIVTSTLDLVNGFSDNMTLEELEKEANQRFGNLLPPDNAVSTPWLIIGTVIGSVVVFIALVVVIIFVVVHCRQRYKTNQNRPDDSVSDDSERDVQIMSNGIVAGPPSNLVWQSSSMTSSISRRRGNDVGHELTFCGLDCDESYVGGKDDELDKNCVRGNVVDPALSYFNAFSPSSFTIPRPEIVDASRFDDPGGRRKDQKKGAVEVKGQNKVTSVNETKGVNVGRTFIAHDELRDFDDVQRAKMDVEMAPTRVIDQYSWVSNEDAAVGGRGAVRGESQLANQTSRVSSHLSSANSSNNNNNNVNNITNPAADDNNYSLQLFTPEIFTNRTPIFQAPRSSAIRPPAFGQSTQSHQATFEGLFVPSIPPGGESNSTGSNDRLLIDSRTLLNTDDIDRKRNDDLSTTTPTTSLEEESISDVLTFHGTKEPSQIGIFTRLQNSLSSKSMKNDNIHRTPTRQKENKSRPHLHDVLTSTTDNSQY